MEKQDEQEINDELQLEYMITGSYPKVKLLSSMNYTIKASVQ